MSEYSKAQFISTMAADEEEAGSPRPEMSMNREVSASRETGDPLKDKAATLEVALTETGQEAREVEELLRETGCELGDGKLGPEPAAIDLLEFEMCQNVDALNAAGVEFNRVKSEIERDDVGPEVEQAISPGQQLEATNDTASNLGKEEKERQQESIWSGETKTIQVDNVNITASKNFSEAISGFLSTLHLPERLYAGDRAAPIKPIDVYAAIAEGLGVKGKNIVFEIGDASFIDKTEDGQSLIVCLSKFQITSPRGGLLDTLSLNSLALGNNSGKVRMDKAAREDIASQTKDRVFGRARYGEALGYQIPAERQRAYYRGVNYKKLGEVAKSQNFKGGNSDSLLAILEPTVWVYSDPGMAESFGGKGEGVVFKLKKQDVDQDFKTEPGWQRWTNNEVMIQPPDDGAKEFNIPLGQYVEEVIVFDEEGDKMVGDLLPDVSRTFLKTKEEGEQYLKSNGEMTDDELEKYYNDPNKLDRYCRPLPKNDQLAFLGIDDTMGYEECRQKMQEKSVQIKDEILSALGRSALDNKWATMYGIRNLKELVMVLHNHEQNFRLPPEVKKVVEQRPGVIVEVVEKYEQLCDVERLLGNFDRQQQLRAAAEKFKKQV